MHSFPVCFIFPTIARDLFGDDAIVGEAPRERPRTFIFCYLNRVMEYQWHTYKFRVDRELAKIDKMRKVIDAQWEGKNFFNGPWPLLNIVSAIAETKDIKVLQECVTEAKELIKLLEKYEEKELLEKLGNYKKQVEVTKKHLAWRHKD